MMKKALILLMACIVLLPSCARSTGEVWEDTKTCGRYMGKGVRSLFGHHVDSREAATYYEAWADEGEFVPLADVAEYETLSLETLATELPGEVGSKIPGIEGFSAPSGRLAQIFNNVHFDTDNYSIRGTENVEILRQIATYLAGHPNTYAFIEGHADERGAAAYNLALGSRRSNAVRTFLIQNGANPDQLFTISFGKERPIAQGSNAAAWKVNRRAQFKLYER